MVLSFAFKEQVSLLAQGVQHCFQCHLPQIQTELWHLAYGFVIVEKFQICLLRNLCKDLLDRLIFACRVMLFSFCAQLFSDKVDKHRTSKKVKKG